MHRIESMRVSNPSCSILPFILYWAVLPKHLGTINSPTQPRKPFCSYAFSTSSSFTSVGPPLQICFSIYFHDISAILKIILPSGLLSHVRHVVVPIRAVPATKHVQVIDNSYFCRLSGTANCYLSRSPIFPSVI